MKVFLGLLVGLFLFGGYVGFERYSVAKDPCLGRCGDGTECAEGVCVVSEGKVGTKRRRHGRRRGRRRRHRRRGGAKARVGTGTSGTTAPEEPPAKVPTAAGLRQTTQGPSLNKTDYVDMSKGGGGGRELGTAEVTRAFRRLDRRIVACIDQARGDWDLRSGKVVVGFRLERNGRIRRVRVSAPAVLQRAGLAACITRLVKSMRYPQSSRALVMSYPFRLN